MLEGNALPLVQVSSIALDIKVEGLTFLYLNLDFMTHPIRFLSLSPSILKKFQVLKRKNAETEKRRHFKFLAWVQFHF